MLGFSRRNSARAVCASATKLPSSSLALIQYSKSGRPCRKTTSFVLMAGDDRCTSRHWEATYGMASPTSFNSQACQFAMEVNVSRGSLLVFPDGLGPPLTLTGRAQSMGGGLFERFLHSSDIGRCLLDVRFTPKAAIDRRGRRVRNRLLRYFVPRRRDIRLRIAKS